MRNLTLILSIASMIMFFTKCTSNVKYQKCTNVKAEKFQVIEIRYNHWDWDSQIFIASQSNKLFKYYAQPYKNPRGEVIMFKQETINNISNYILRNCNKVNSQLNQKELKPVFEITIINDLNVIKCYINESDGNIYFKGLLNSIRDNSSSEHLGLELTMRRLNYLKDTTVR